MSTPVLDTSPWLVATKLHPPRLRGEIVRRPRLEAALSSAVSTLPFTLLSAPAGYGKTTMLASLTHLLPETPLAWVTFDEEDNDPTRFLGLITAALGTVHPDCGRSVWTWLAGGTAGLKRAVAALIEDLQRTVPGPCILVLDDLHTITEPAAYIALEYLLEHQPPQLHIAVGTRHDPPLRLARLAARRQLAELRRPDLHFLPEEARQLLNESLGLQLTGPEVAALQERTEGWPAGLCLLAGPLGRLRDAGDRSEFLAAIAQTERYALDFLAEEVLRDLAPDQRRFLMETAILTEMTPSTCRTVTGREDAAELLESLYRQNLTIAALAVGPAGEPVYRHHALVARLLAQQLQRERPGDLPELHRRAALAAGTPVRAVGHYLAAGLWDEAAALMLRHGTDLVHLGMADTVRNWYAALPEEMRARHPRLAVLMSRCHIQSGEYAAAGQLLRQAQQSFVSTGDGAGEAECLTTLLSVALQNDDRADFAPLVERILAMPTVPPSLVVAHLVRAWVRLGEGDWADVRSDLAEALAVPPATGHRTAAFLATAYMSAPLVASPGCLELTERFCAEAGALALPETDLRLGTDELAAWTLLLRGLPAEALALAKAADDLRRRLGGWPVLGIDSALILAVLHTALGETEAAGEATDALLHRLERSPVTKRGLYLHAAGRALALTGRQPEAQAVLQRLTALPAPLPLTRYLQEHLTGLLALAAGRPDEAEAPLKRASALEPELPPVRCAGSARLLYARAALERGRTEAALSMAAPVLQEWEQAGMPGCSLPDGPLIVPVLRLAAQRGLPGAARLAALFPAITVRQAAAAPAPTPGSNLPEPLTQRELDVLRLIVEGRTNRQIGEELFITEETVKSHVVRILRKLDVTSRTQAAVRGREMGL